MTVRHVSLNDLILGLSPVDLGAEIAQPSPAPLQVQVVDPMNDHPPLLPPGMSEHQMKALDGGTNYSGQIAELMPGQRAKLINAQKRDAEGMIALATVHVSTRELREFRTPDIAIDQRLILHCKWGSGKAGDDEIVVDCTKAAVITIPGTISVEIYAELLSANVASGVSLTVEATCHWGTSVSPRPVLECEPSITFITPDAPVTTGFLRLPERAQKATLVSSDNQAAANTTIEFYRDDSVGAALTYAYRAPDPTRKIDLVSGVRFYKVRYLGPITLTVIPDFELAL